MAVKMLMKGAILPGNSTVEIKDFEIPKPGYGQVLIKTKATTICGSDIRCIYREHTGKGPEGYIPGMVAGHEPCAVFPDWNTEDMILPALPFPMYGTVPLSSEAFSGDFTEHMHIQMMLFTGQITPGKLIGIHGHPFCCKNSFLIGRNIAAYLIQDRHRFFRHFTCSIRSDIQKVISTAAVNLYQKRNDLGCGFPVMVVFIKAPGVV